MTQPNHTPAPNYAAYNGKYFIWALYNNLDGDCCTSYLPSVFSSLDVVEKMIARNKPAGFYPVICEGLNPVRVNGECVKAITKAKGE